MLNSRLTHRAIWIALLLGITWFYAATIDFGFIWDDPQWFGRVVNKSWLELIRPSASFQFYRPGSMLYNRLFLQADGTFAAEAQHWLQVCWHLLHVALIYAIGRRLGLARWPAAAVATLVALYPMSYQAVAWAAPQQPMAATIQNGAWLAYLIGRQPGRRAVTNAQGHPARRWAMGLSLALFVIALTIQETTAALALLLLLYELVLNKNRGQARPTRSFLGKRLAPGWQWVLVYPLLSAVYIVIWLFSPRLKGIVSWGFEAPVAAYLLQGLIYPILGRPNGYPPDHTANFSLLFLLSAAVVGLLWGLAWRRGRGGLAAIGLAWALLGILPGLLGLPFSYVSLAPRLFYPAAAGVCILWVCAWWPAPGSFSKWQLAGVLLLGLIAVQSAWLLGDFQHLYQAGANHMNELLEAIGQEEGRYLFLNFPDRYAPKRPPYPVGYWGVTLAPVVVELGEFPAALTGRSPQTESRSLPWIDAEARASGPYILDTRGVIIEPDALYSLAAWQDAIYLSRHLPDGRFSLQPAGHLEPAAAPACQMALFDDSACLQSMAVAADDQFVHVTLGWSTTAALPPYVTIFTHLGLIGQPPLTQSDGDTWRTTLPLAIWRPGDLIIEERTLERPAAAGDLFLQVGLYDWVSGVRLVATTPDGAPLANNAFAQPVSTGETAGAN